MDFSREAIRMIVFYAPKHFNGPKPKIGKQEMKSAEIKNGEGQLDADTCVFFYFVGLDVASNAHAAFRM